MYVFSRFDSPKYKWPTSALAAFTISRAEGEATPTPISAHSHCRKVRRRTEEGSNNFDRMNER